VKKTSFAYWLKALCTFVAFHLSTPSFAFEIFPEYQGLSETELTRIEGPAEIDSEYQSQINAYTAPLQREFAWFTTPRAIDTSVGSITNQHFLIHSRVKLTADLLETLRFQFSYFAVRDREIDQTRGIVELSQKISTWLRVNVYGQPEHYKRGNDVGFALLILPALSWENRFYATFHDFTRGNHNDQADRFVGLDPLSLGWNSTYTTTNSLVRVGLRFDRSVSWNLPQLGQSFAYEKKLAYADVLWPLSETEQLVLRLQWDMTFKGETPYPASTSSAKCFKRDRLLTRFSYFRGQLDDWISYEASVLLADRHWIDKTGSHLFHQNLMPSLAARVRSVRREQGFDHFQVSLEATDFRTFGDLSLAPENQKHQALEERLQTAYEFNFRARGALFLALNFDLDEWSTLPTFDGGNAQFRVDF
jgi:hypothetical protein